ncbi:hypothetical protein TNCV_3073381 [Trichonephila clavipes]|nr:hypothetical protein TNCV_3073381 [Trichonephila clavipes]
MSSIFIVDQEPVPRSFAWSGDEFCNFEQRLRLEDNTCAVMSPSKLPNYTNATTLSLNIFNPPSARCIFNDTETSTYGVDKAIYEMVI